MRREELQEAVGPLAHDINNLLTAILGYANLVGRSLDAGDPRRPDVTEIVQAARHAGELARRLVQLSASSRPEDIQGSDPGIQKDAVVRGSERVLVVEDEPAVRKLVRRVLARAGYDVGEAASIELADAWLSEHGATASIVIADIRLPGGTGEDLYRRALTRWPLLKVLYMSGFTLAVIQRDRLLAPGAPFIQKPFTSDHLSRKVREVLDH